MSERSGNYVAAWLDHAADKIIVLERDPAGALTRVQYDPPYYFYVESEGGTYTSIFGETLARIELRTRAQYDAAKQHARTHGFRLFESDIHPLKRLLMDRYHERRTPPVNYAFVDIEVDYQQALGFAGPANPYAPINAITVYQSWTRSFLTAAVPPPGWNGAVSDLRAKIQQLIDDEELRSGNTPEAHICSCERDLIEMMLGWIADADILSGWNSELFDLPYICERLLAVGGEPLLGKLDYPGTRFPKKDTVKRYGTEQRVYKLAGRGHIDYMRAFQKFNHEGRASYALGNILQEEIGLGKLHYEGTLEQLYHTNFPTFVAYNFRDVDGLAQLDAKFKFLDLINQMAHENTVSFEAILGTVAYVETGITNYAHHKLNKIVRDKAIKKKLAHVEGAVVLSPKSGLHRNIGSVDIRSLYPNTIRSLNISPETIVGQFAEKERAWHELRAQSHVDLTLTLEGGRTETAPAAVWRPRLIQSKWAVSGYGTVFDQSAGQGLLPEVLGYWYAERKRLQAEKKKYSALARDEADPVKRSEYQGLEAQFDLLQQTKKISMNSLYAALLNAGFRFGDERLGASTTGTGRQITTHMIETITYLLTGEKSKLQKTSRTDKKGVTHNDYSIGTNSIIYGDTDSCYFNTGGETVDEAIAIADGVAEAVNETFPTFMREACLCRPEFDTLISVSRELVGSRGLFLEAKKKYTIKVVDQEGAACNRLKSMGSEIRKSDTPKVIQKVLSDMMAMILDGKSHEEIAQFVIEQRCTVIGKAQNLFAVGVAKQVNRLEKYQVEYDAPGTMRNPTTGRALSLPGHCRAALNYNRMVAEYESGAKPIRSGDKILIYYLQPNRYKFEAIAFPAESGRFPQWFADNFEVDVALTEFKLFDKKLKGIFDALGIDISSAIAPVSDSVLTA
jgi:DNA polymerase elongation subunit (family B)